MLGTLSGLTFDDLRGPEVKDSMLGTLSGLTFDDLRGPVVKDDCSNKIEDAYPSK